MSRRPAGRQSRTVLDVEGRPVLFETGNLTPTELSYDAQGRINGITRGAARVTTMGYDTDGNLQSITDPLSRTVGFTYDDADRVTVQTLPDGRQIGYGYDANGNLTAITPPGRPAHAFTYTGNDQQRAYIPPNVVPPLAEPRTFYSYYLDGQLARITRPDGQQVNFTYDPETGQLLSQVLPGAQQIQYRYNLETGNLERIGAPDGGQISYGYDGSLPLSETWTVTAAGSVSRTYDPSFRVSSQSVNGANTVSFTYDNDDLLTGAGALTLVRDPINGLLASTSIDNGTGGTVTDTLTHDTFGELQSYGAQHDDGVTTTDLYTASHTRDDLGRITSITETVTVAPQPSETTARHFKYDPAGRLWRVCLDDACITVTAEYQYDPNGNRIAGSFNDVSGGLVGATYDDQDRLLAFSFGLSALSFSYTANGELTSKTTPTGTTTYNYDVLGNLLDVTLPDSTFIEYVIDGQNRRVGKKVNGTLVQGFLYQDQLNPVAELDGAGNVVARFVYGSKPNVPEYLIRSPDTQHPTPQTYRIISDHLGSVRLVVDIASGEVAQRIDYDEFGDVLTNTNPGFQPFGFAGGIYDADTGLVRFGARDYDPEIGRWTAKDPIGFNGGDQNLYGYVISDPVNNTDPAGRDATLGGTLGALALGAVVADIGLNIRLIEGRDGRTTVHIPPPSTFDRGLPFPFFFGADFVVREVRLPLLGIVGIPDSFYITADTVLRYLLGQGHVS